MKEPIINTRTTSRVAKDEICIFGEVLDPETEEPLSVEIALKLNGDIKSFLPQTRDGKFWFRLNLGFGLHRIRVLLWKFNMGGVETIIESDPRWLFSLNKSGESEVLPWVERIDLGEIYEKARISIGEMMDEMEFNEAYVVGRALVRGSTMNDIDIKLISPDATNSRRLIEKITELNRIASKKVKYPVDVVISDGNLAYGHEQGIYDLSGCTEVRSKIYDAEKGFIDKPNREVFQHPGRMKPTGVSIYERGEELTEEELEAVEQGSFITRGECREYTARDI